MKTLVVIAMAILMYADAMAQDIGIIDITSPTGVRVSGDFYDQTLLPSEKNTFKSFLDEAPARPFRFAIIPATARTDGATLFGLRAGIFAMVSGDRLAQFAGGYQRTLLDDAGGTDAFTASGMLTVISVDDALFSRDLPTSVQMTGEATRVRDSATKLALNLAAEQPVWKRSSTGRQVNLGASVGFASSDADDAAAVSDVSLAGGIKFVVNARTYLSADYILENDVNGEDVYSLTFNQIVSGPRFPGLTRLTIGVRKHKTVTLGLVTLLR